MTHQPEECPFCTNPERVLYEEYSQAASYRVKMCYECPVLEEKLAAFAEGTLHAKKEKESIQLFCTSCKASLHQIKTGEAYGCGHCHALFDDLLIDEVLSQNQHISYREMEDDKPPSHLFKEKLVVLHKDLKEALQKEHYELAAQLRDEIQAISKKNTTYSNYNYS